MVINRRNLVAAILLLIACVFVYLEYNAARFESLTWDEKAHFTFGYFALYNSDFSIDPLSGTFISQLLVLPTIFDQQSLINIHINPSDQLLHVRMTNVFITLILAFTVFYYCRYYFSLHVAIASFVFILFEPLLFANAHYISIDIGFTLIFFLSFWFFNEFLSKNSSARLALSGISAGLLFASKVTGVIFYISTIFVLLLITKKFYPIVSLKKISLFIVAVIIGIWLPYRFTFNNLGGFTEGGNRLSNRIYLQLLEVNKTVADGFKYILDIPLPLGNFPKLIKNSAVYNASEKTTYFLGSIKENPGKLYAVALGLKLPISLIAFFFLGLFSIYGKKEIRYALPPLIILIIMFFSNVPLRLRYIFPIYPYISIISAYGLVRLLKGSLKAKVFSLFLCIIFFTEFIYSYPYTISSVNLLTKIISKPYMAFSDSDMNWGGGLISLQKYVYSENVGIVNLSYYGTDNPNRYGFLGYSYGEDMCKKSCTIEKTMVSNDSYKTITALSVTNWHECMFYKQERYNKDKIIDSVDGQFLIFK